ncbi:MAG: undecaprenyl-diphosphate phosphatase [Pseudomonadota bacterium]
MDLLQIIILAIVQGITEFLPVSSSAHLILVPLLTDWQDQGLAIDVAAHLGSLVAVIHYFRVDLWRLIQAGMTSIKMRSLDDYQAQLFWLICLASFPVLTVGLLGHDIISSHLRHPLIIAVATIIFALVLWYADKFGKRVNTITQLSFKTAMLIGMAQILALIPGTSRSGITMTAALMLGFDRQAAARFSFYLAIPVILCAAAYECLSLFKSDSVIEPVNFLLTAGLSAITAWISIHFFLRFIDRVGMLPFVIYRILLGTLLIAMFI